MAISSVQEIGPVVYSGKKEEGGLLIKWKVAQDTSESEEMLNGLILYIGTGKPSNGY